MIDSFDKYFESRQDTEIEVKIDNAYSKYIKDGGPAFINLGKVEAISKTELSNMLKRFKGAKLETGDQGYTIVFDKEIKRLSGEDKKEQEKTNENIITLKRVDDMRK